MKTIRLHLQSLPPGTPPEAPLFLAGNVNDWQPGDTRFQFEKQSDGTFALEFGSDLAFLEFKITRGHWSTAEGDTWGNERPNRGYKIGFPINELGLRIESWTDLRHVARQNTLPENVLLLHPEFYAPQLGRARRIWACLPPDYWVSENRRYPVVYMQDGQNLFDNPEAVFGSWGVDQALNRLFVNRIHKESEPGDTGRHPIFIAIENGGEHRIGEYSPWTNPEYGGGDGGQYLAFVCETLKPFVDAQLRTLSGREHTGVAGSSMGGLLSLFAVLERPDVFGMAGVFSPSLWFSPEVLTYVKTRRPEAPARILLMAGQRESKTMVSDLLDLYEALLGAGHADHDLHYDLHGDGAHAEWFWAREFEHALRWLFGEMPGHTHGVSGEWIDFQLDEKNKNLVLHLDHQLRQPVLEVHDYCCDRQFRHVLTGAENHIPYSDWQECLYSIRLLSEGDLVFSRRVHLNELKKTRSKARKQHLSTATLS